MLRTNSATATFFLTSDSVAGNEALVRRIVAEGHEIGHHGWVHEGLSPLSEDEERSVIERGIEALEPIIGLPAQR